MTNFIFVTGGVCSSLGKGVSAASIGCLLEKHGFSVALQKFDPYINVDPGTMSPHQHGEVFVTEDGAETDLDLGYYERFTHCKTSKLNSVSTGQIYGEVIRKERAGEFLGKTVQVIPHITGEIKDRILRLAEKDNPDFLICEIGGTVGDIESIPFLEGIRQFGQEHGTHRCYFIHMTLMTHIHASDELKSKPTQHSVMKLREIGILPNMLLCRSHLGFGKELKEKIALFCNVPWNHVIDARDAEKSIYEIPKLLHEQNVDRIILDHFALPGKERLRLDKWNKYTETIKTSDEVVRIGMIGKYMELNDAYCSIHEAIRHAAVAHEVYPEIVPIAAEEIDESPDKAIEFLSSLDGIIVPGGFGGRGFEGMIKATGIARENAIPFLGICLGMQCATVEIARHLLGIPNANSAEFMKHDDVPIICYMDEQRGIVEKGGTMRLGLQECKLSENSLSYQLYGKTPIIYERHRHRCEFNQEYTLQFEQQGIIIAGIHPERKLVEIIEIPYRPFFVGVQFHPEFTSKPLDPHPLFVKLLTDAKERANSTALPLHVNEIWWSQE